MASGRRVGRCHAPKPKNMISNRDTELRDVVVDVNQDIGIFIAGCMDATDEQG